LNIDLPAGAPAAPRPSTGDLRAADARGSGAVALVDGLDLVWPPPVASVSTTCLRARVERCTKTYG
jgi:hypothetical protein